MLFDPQWDKSVEPDTNDEWRDVLRRAANLIERTGWIKGNFLDRDSAGRISGYCALGAIGSTRGGEAGKQKAEDKLWEFLNSKPPRLAHLSLAQISRWNDSQTDKKVVIDAMRQAAKA